MDYLKTLGKFLGRVYRFCVVRPLQRYNVENRTYRLLDKIEKSKTPVVKPRLHYPDEKFLEELIKKHPEILENVQKTSPELIEKIKQLKVKVEAIPYEYNVKIESEDTREMIRKLPERRKKVFLSEMGVKDPEHVPIGKISLREAMQAVRAHTADPEEYPVEKIAKTHEMSEEDVFNILDHFKGYQVYHPEKFYEEGNYQPKVPWYKKETIEDWLLGGSGWYEIPNYQDKVEERQRLLEARDKAEKEAAEMYRAEKEAKKEAEQGASSSSSQATKVSTLSEDIETPKPPEQSEELRTEETSVKEKKSLKES